MGAFSKVATRLPPANVIVPPSAFADTWDERPEHEVCIGLRFVSDTELEDARIEAFRRAEGIFENRMRNDEVQALWIASFQDALMRWVIARGTCDPNDVTRPWQGWAAAPEDMVPVALSDQGAQLIYDAWERMRIANDIGTAAASDEDLARFSEFLPRLDVLETLSRPRALRLRRLMRFVLQELAEVEVDETPKPSPEEVKDLASAMAAAQDAASVTEG